MIMPGLHFAANCAENSIGCEERADEYGFISRLVFGMGIKVKYSNFSSSIECLERCSNNNRNINRTC
jgi:hypothetical protein